MDTLDRNTAEASSVQVTALHSDHGFAGQNWTEMDTNNRAR